ncbi:MAG: hypothetical protein ACOZBH_01735 [Patescibacteria group bacterium]
MEMLQAASDWDSQIVCEKCEANFKITADDLILTPSSVAVARQAYVLCPCCHERFDFSFELLPRVAQLSVLARMRRIGRPILLCCDRRNGQFLLPF